jgi:signal transduction histidine kinase
LLERAEEEGQLGFLPDIEQVRDAGGKLLAVVDNTFQSIPSAEPAPVAAPAPALTVQARLRETIESGPAAGTVQGRLLVVDDDQANRDVLSRRLKRQGYTVVTAESGFLALKMMRESSFDLVLLDILMPEMDGFEVLKVLKADEKLQHIPVIMISATSEAESAVRCIQMGAEDFLTKPFDPVLLRARTVACLDRKRAHDLELRFTSELQASYRHSQQLEQMRDDLTNMIVHDLRTPLTSLISGLQTMEPMGDLNEIQEEMLEISLSSGQTLLGMINDLLDIGKMESGALVLDMQDVLPAEIVGFAMKQIEFLATSKGLELITEIDSTAVPIPADGDKLLRTLVNLLSNAVKFTPTGGTVAVSVRKAENADAMQFSVNDSGEGIPSEAFERIFEKFGQVETREAGRRHSTGLGLTFCKLVVEAHGGQIWVRSDMGKGSTFLFTIPLNGRSGPVPA